MTLEEFESLLESGIETQRLDYKGACNWDVDVFAKDILALSNVRDGGYLVMGVDETDTGYKRTGTTTEQRRTFNIDIMKDQMNSFADPYVDFEVSFPTDRLNLQYIVVSVKEFRDIPIICKRNSRETHAGVIYFRNRNRRPESAPVSNSYDMREIIESATVKLMRRSREFGYSVENIDEKLFNDELGGL
ncbi:ATP-binding protein [candidate division WOR-3 bacterium]|nr:ATP-binding protein [candidate division WOR-3 bacterium]